MKQMRVLTTLALLFALSAPARADCVVLLHGLARTEYSMLLIQEMLEFHGYRVVNHSYPSESAPIEDLVRHVGRSVGRCGGERTHFVTHSMGGILVRIWLERERPLNMGRVVMLAPPNNGSEIVDLLVAQDILPGLLEFVTGPAGRELGTDADSVPAQLGPVDYELGIIAGNRALSPLGPILIEGANDGTVSVDSTRVAGMRDHIVLATTHTLMMGNPIVLAEILEFLRNGVFDHGITLTGALRKLAQR